MPLHLTFYHETCEQVNAGHAKFYSKSDKDSSFHIETDAVDRVLYYDYKPDECKTAVIYDFYHPSEECSKEWNSKCIFDGEELKMVSFSEDNCGGNKTTDILGKAGCHDHEVCTTEDCYLHTAIQDRRTVVSNAISNKSSNGILFAALLLLLINSMML